MAVAALVSTEIADCCPPGVSDKHYIKMLQTCIFELSAERARLCRSHVQNIEQLRQDLDFSYSEKLAKVTKELEQLKDDGARRPLGSQGIWEGGGAHLCVPAYVGALSQTGCSEEEK